MAAPDGQDLRQVWIGLQKPPHQDQHAHPHGIGIVIPQQLTGQGLRIRIAPERPGIEGIRHSPVVRKRCKSSQGICRCPKLPHLVDHEHMRLVLLHIPMGKVCHKRLPFLFGQPLRPGPQRRHLHPQDFALRDQTGKKRLIYGIRQILQPGCH